jgi:hypothetical protein
MNTRINSLQAKPYTIKQPQIKTKGSVDTQKSLTQIAYLASNLKAERNDSKVNKPLDPLDLLMRASQKTFDGEGLYETALKKKEDLSKTTQDPAVMASLDKQIKQGDKQYRF